MIYEATDENIAKAGEILKNGGVVAIPTETVYGLAANALSETAVKKIFEIRQYHFATSYLVFISAPAQINHSIL